MVWEDPLSVSSLTQDVRYALRILRQSPLFTAVAVSSLALGIGANTAIFTLTDAILLRWLPVNNPQELVTLARNPSQPTTSSSYPDYCYLRDHSRSYAGLIALPLVILALFNRRARMRWFWFAALAICLAAMFGFLPIARVLALLPGIRYSWLTRLQMAIPVPIKARPPGGRTTGSGTHARRSSPEDPGVAGAGKGSSAPPVRRIRT